MSVFGAIFARGAAARELTGEAYLQAMLDVEAALAAAQAELGLIPDPAARAITEHARASEFDLQVLAEAATSTMQPVIPLVAALRERVGPAAAPYVHWGATSQDVLDTATMCIAMGAVVEILRDATRAHGAARRLAQEHAQTPMLGRTLLQPAAPTTFGLVAAGWAAALDRARLDLNRIAERDLAVQLGGAAGTAAAWGDQAVPLTRALARRLGLVAPGLPWHEHRGRVLALAAALAGMAGTAGKIGRDVTLLAQGEVGEVRERPEPGRGGSSTMAHKHNPVAALGAVACAARMPGLLATIAAAQIGDLQRAAGAWQAEWETILDLLRLTGSAVAWMSETLRLLQVDAPRMRENLARSGLDGDLAAQVEAAARLTEASLGEEVA